MQYTYSYSLYAVWCMRFAYGTVLRPVELLSLALLKIHATESKCNGKYLHNRLKLCTHTCYLVFFTFTWAFFFLFILAMFYSEKYTQYSLSYIRITHTAYCIHCVSVCVSVYYNRVDRTLHYIIFEKENILGKNRTYPMSFPIVRFPIPASFTSAGVRF